TVGSSLRSSPEKWSSAMSNVVPKTLTRRGVIAASLGAAAATSAVTVTNAAALSQTQGGATTRVKPVLVFDVNETLLDIDVLNPLFDRMFGTPGRMREW